MDVPLIEMDREEAIERLEEYRGALRRGADEEYAAAVKGYEALAAGTPVISLGEAIRGAPRDGSERPMLAIARADRQYVQVSASPGWGSRSSHIFFDCTAEFRQAVPIDSLLLVHLTTPDRAWARDMKTGYAMVPIVPPGPRAKAGGRSRLRDHLILWEVEEWSDTRYDTAPDIDPLLLRPIHGDLCAVVAAWDLTDLERAVMAGRAGI